ncbi:MAG: 23S rRNA (pseudouridine(1915)-N(3))-methyltransferase RlmH [Alphaproteobacteria bacterium]|nr:23S rRNA (pseudouridine(1915)-N(3))-methyltransferase RlmH [Alphaproteobacteria bacterium]
MPRQWPKCWHMLKGIEIIAVGKMKSKHMFTSAFETYQKRISSKLTLIELEGRSQVEELQKVKEKIREDSPLIILDETGHSVSSADFANSLKKLQEGSKSGPFQFVIGGADGLDESIREQADLVISFGKQTWPHMMVRVMLMEQIYRAQQILSGHPYHRA